MSIINRASDRRNLSGPIKVDVDNQNIHRIAEEIMDEGNRDTADGRCHSCIRGALLVLKT